MLFFYSLLEILCIQFIRYLKRDNSFSSNENTFNVFLTLILLWCYQINYKLLSL